MQASEPALHPRFQPAQAYAPIDGSTYRVLPMRFIPLDAARYVATNFAGEHVVVVRAAIENLVLGRLRQAEPDYALFKSRGFLIDGASDVAIDLLATQYRTKQAPLADFTALHLFVVTLRCDHACPYCQVSRVSQDRTAFDMTPEMADRAVDLVFRSPAPALKIEFQGGEPLLRFDLVRRIVERAESINATERRSLEFVVATNLSQLTDEMLEFLRDHRVYVSTSLDGPRALHNANRPRPGGDSYECAVRGIERVRAALGPSFVSALMTTTQLSLEQPEAIIDEYVRQGFDAVFIRWLSPYGPRGFAANARHRIGYDASTWQRFYERGLRYVLRLNATGVQFREQYAALVLRRLLTPYGTGYVDLRSPTGLGIAVAVYNYDGDVYLSDEARMLAEMDDKTFRLGNVLTDSYEELFHADRLQDIVFDTMSEGIPQCTECAFQPVCGTDPTFHHATQGDAVGHRPTSDFCRRNMFVMKLLVTLLEDEPTTAEVLRGWAR